MDIIKRSSTRSFHFIVSLCPTYVTETRRQTREHPCLSDYYGASTGSDALNNSDPIRCDRQYLTLVVRLWFLKQMLNNDYWECCWVLTFNYKHKLFTHIFMTLAVLHNIVHKKLSSRENKYRKPWWWSLQDTNKTFIIDSIHNCLSSFIHFFPKSVFINNFYICFRQSTDT